MKHPLALALLLMGFTSCAVAGPFNDKLSVCLVKSTTEADKSVLMRWIFAAMASHPAVKDLGNISEARGSLLNKEMAGLYWDLVSVRCVAETKDAIRYEGASALGASFEVLGKVAMQGLMGDAQVTKFMAGVDANLDQAAMKALLETPPGKK